MRRLSKITKSKRGKLFPESRSLLGFIKRNWRRKLAIGALLSIFVLNWRTVVACQSFSPLKSVGDCQNSEVSSSPIKYLPAWFEENRVQGHTRLSIKKWLDTPEFINAADGFKQLGANVFVRHVKSGQEDPWWSSTVPLTSDGLPKLDNHPNLIEEMVADAHQKGMKMLAYYFISTDKTIAELHPEWLCKRPNGKILAHRRRGNYLDITSPYREIILQRLLELAEMGVDGFYFDELHMPYKGCWGTPLESAFQEATGREVPKVIDETDPDYRLYLEFIASQVEENFAYWRDTVHQKYPEVVFVVSTTTIPSLINPRMTTNLVRLADSPKSEFFLALNKRFNLKVFEKNSSLAKPEDDIRMVLGWTLLRDSAEGRPPHIWTSGFSDRQQTLAFVSAVLTYGAIANLDVAEANLLDVNRHPEKTPREALEAAFALGNKVSPYLSHTRPVRWAAIHFSERSRDYRGGDLVTAWREVLWPVTGAFGVFVREGLPVGIVNDYQLENGQLDGYKLLFLPNLDELTPSQRQSVEQFEANGGVVIKNDKNWTWSVPSKTTQASNNFRQVLQSYLDTAPVRVTEGSKGIHAVAFERQDSGRLVLAVTNDFTWIQLKKHKGMRSRHQLTSINSPPSPISGVEVEIKTSQVPSKVFEVISGQLLKPEVTSDGYKLVLPEFSTMALLVVE